MEQDPFSGVAASEVTDASGCLMFEGKEHVDQPRNTPPPSLTSTATQTTGESGYEEEPQNGTGPRQQPLSYTYRAIPYPKDIPVGFHPDNDANEMVEPSSFSPSTDLDFRPPDEIVNLRFQRMSLTDRDWDDPRFEEELSTFLRPGLAFTSPFRLLSGEGLDRLRRIILHHSANKSIINKKTSRQAWCIRGLGYASPYIRDMNESTFIREICSKLSGEKLCPHSLVTNYSHVNIGNTGGNRPVDQWHRDSVDYVLVILVSEPAGMRGGELEVIAREGENAEKVLAEGSTAAEDILRVEFPAAGYGILMQGSEIYHQVKPVLEAQYGPRISVIHSYMSRDVFKGDRTRYATFRDGDPHFVAPLEYARHRAWRVQGQLDFILNEIKYDHPDGKEREERGKKLSLRVLEQAIQELVETHALLSETKEDALGYFDSAMKSFRKDKGGVTPK